MFYPNLMHIGANDLVLEIGPGAFPHWRSDCLVDKFEENDLVDLGQFGGLPQNTQGKPLFIIKDGLLPFKDKSFDYIICSHVFEHVDVEELPTLIAEMERVSSRFYIEFPTFNYDVIYDFPVHVNLMDIINGEILCLPKSKSKLQHIAAYNKVFHRARELYLRGFEPGYPEFFAVGQEFHDKIPFRILDSDEQLLSFTSAKYAQAPKHVRPNKWFYFKNKIASSLRKLKGEKQVTDFKTLLKNA
jgi:hypothetical protein